ncbi:MAG: hypothetical protein WKF55_04630 [Gemmatimonadaceae bacterium]
MHERPIWQFVIGIFLISGLVSGLVSGALASGIDGSVWLTAITAGLSSGVTMAVALGGALYVWARAAGFRKIPAPRQSAEITYEGDVSSARDAAVRALSVLQARSIVIAGTEQIRIAASTRMTWKSFGERIEIIVARIDDRRSSVRVATRPVRSLTVIDYGKGLENVRKFSEALLGGANPRI